jgi:hypothetical protein
MSTDPSSTTDRIDSEIYRKRSLTESVHRLYSVWKQIFSDVPVLAVLDDPNGLFFGWYERRELIGFACDERGKNWTVGHVSLTGEFLPNAGPFTTSDATIPVLLGMVANNKANRTLAKMS